MNKREATKRYSEALKVARIAEQDAERREVADVWYDGHEAGEQRERERIITLLEAKPTVSNVKNHFGVFLHREELIALIEEEQS